MNNYNFSTLNDKEFEEFVKDLLNEEFKLGLKSFSSGKDKGIDLRKTSTTNKNHIVVQIKHYLNSKYAALKNVIIKDEVAKVTKLYPNRYMFVTSQNLSAIQRDEIKKLFSPYIINDDDIFSQTDLNDLLSKHQNIEIKYYKLWLSSTKILSNILNNAIESRTRYFLENITDKIKYYVPTDKINDANRILNEHKILLVTGQPGIGKTTLAEIIIFERAKNNYKIYKIEDINEAEDVINNNPDDKQLFYFDDFLGANYLEIKYSNLNENRLTSFVERIHNSKNKYLILTSRTIVYNRAITYSEKINNSKITNSTKFELELDDYNKYEKALILYNHFYFKGIGKEYFDIIKKDKFYFTIIDHENYTPRIIDFFSDISKINKIKEHQYQEYILNSLNKPEAIWNYSFNNQIEYLERCLLLTLFSFTNFAREKEFNTAFQERLQYEKITNNQIIESNQFEKSIKVLLNGFIKSVLYNYSNSIIREFQFLNPSLTDYLIDYVNQSFNEKQAIISSSIYLKQLERFDTKNKVNLEKELQKLIIERIKSNSFLDMNGNYGIIKIIDFIFRNCTDVNVDYIIFQNLNLINFSKELDYFEYESIINLLENCEEENLPQTYSFIKLNFDKIINSLFVSIEDEYYSSTILQLFEQYEIDYKKYQLNNIKTIESFINNVLKLEEENNIDTLKYNVRNIDEVNSLYSDLENTMKKLKKELLISDFNYEYEIDEDYWYEKIYDNTEPQEEETSTKYQSTNEINYDRKINNLFK